MQNAGHKLEQLFLKAGQTHCYQYIITILLTFEFCCSHFLNYCLPYLERIPEINAPDPVVRDNMLSEFCKGGNHTLIKEEKRTSIVNEFEIYCSKTKTYFLGLCYYFGKIIGSCISYLFIDVIGRKKTFFIFIPISIILMCTFEFMKASYSHNWIYGVFAALFFSGFANYIIVVDILIYICEIIQQAKIPYFIMIVATGTSISGLICSVTFHVDSPLDYGEILLIFGGIHLIIYILIIFFFIDSPMFALNEEDFEKFSLNIKKIAARNGKNLTKEDFVFLAPYMSKEAKKKLFEIKPGEIDQKVLTMSSMSNNLYINESKNINDITNINYNDTYNKLKLDNNINFKEALNNYNINKNIIYNQNFNSFINNNQNKGQVNDYNVNNMIISNNQMIFAPEKNIKETNLLKNQEMKDLYLLSLGEDSDFPAKSLFGGAKMNDFTPLDLLRFQTQIKNFLTLSFIWIVTVIIRTGIDLRKKYVVEYLESIQYAIINFGLDIVLPIFLLLIYHKYQYSIQRILITANLIQFIFFVLVGLFTQKRNERNERTQIILLILGKVCCHAVYLVMYILTSEIYPIIIRTKGVGLNIGFSGIGTIIAVFLIENLKYESLILYFLLFNFFSLVICYGLPNKIGTLLLENPKKLKEDEDDEDIKLGDIYNENPILVNPKQQEIPSSVHPNKIKETN